MDFHVMTLFPDMIMQGLSDSVIGRAVRKGTIGLHTVNIRDYSLESFQPGNCCRIVKGRISDFSLRSL